IDFGAEEVFEDEDGIHIYAPFESFGALQKELERRGIEILSSGFERIPQVTKKLSPEEEADVEKLLERLEEDDDVQHVYHTMEESEEYISFKNFQVFYLHLHHRSHRYFSGLLQYCL